MAGPHVAASIAAPVSNNGVNAASWALIDGSGTATEGDSRMLSYLDTRRIGLSGARRFSPARQRTFNSRFSRAANYDQNAAVHRLVNPRYRAAGVTDLTTEYFVAGCKFKPSKTAHTTIYNLIKGANPGEELTWKGELKEANGFFSMRCMTSKAAVANNENTRCTYVARVDNYVWDTAPTAITAGATNNDPQLMAWFSYPESGNLTGVTPATPIPYDERNVNLGDMKAMKQGSKEVTYTNDGSCEGARISYTTIGAAPTTSFSEQGQWRTLDSNNLVAGSAGTPILEDGLQYNMRHFLSYNDGDATNKFITAAAGADVAVTPRWMFDEMWVAIGSIKSGGMFGAGTQQHIPFACCKPERMPARSEERYYNKILRYQARICAVNSPGHVLVPGQTNPGTCDPALARAGTGQEVAALNTVAERP